MAVVFLQPSHQCLTKLARASGTGVNMHCLKAFYSLLLGRMKKFFASLSKCLLSFRLLETFVPSAVPISKTRQAA